MKTQIFSENDFIEFSNKIESLCEKVQLTDWRWSVVNEPLDHDDAASVYLNYIAKTAKFILAEAFKGEVVTDYHPKELAIHEFLHLLIADLVFVAATTGKADDELVVMHEHALIHRLMKLLNM